MKPNKVKIGISIGDLNGIGIEVILKTFADSRLLNYCTPVIYGSTRLLNFNRKTMNLAEVQLQGVKSVHELNLRKVNVVNVWDEDLPIQFGQPSKEAGIYAIKSLDAAVADWRNELVDVLLTAPINKDNMHMAGFQYPGHTEFLQAALKSKDHLMLMVSDSLKVGLVTSHVAVSEIASKISVELILARLNTINNCLQSDFSIRKPRIAVLGLNPHAGENGLIGNEELTIIHPAIEQAKDEGIMAFGPFPADGFFGSASYLKYDAVLAMYHDQGLTPFKTLSFGDGVNYTAGLPRIRTSPDHGTGYSIAGKGIADASSFKKALYVAIDAFKNRSENELLLSNALVIKPRASDRNEN